MHQLIADIKRTWKKYQAENGDTIYTNKSETISYLEGKDHTGKVRGIFIDLVEKPAQTN